MIIVPRTLRICSNHRLKGFSQYQIQEEHTGKRGERSVYVYRIPRELEGKAIVLGGEYDLQEEKR